MTRHLYHWSLSARRTDIESGGLKIRKTPVVHSRRTGFICTSPDPKTAWQLSGDQISAGDWDLWQITVNHDDEVHTMPHWGPVPDEVRIHNDVPEDRVWRVATRSGAASLSS